MRLRTSLLSLGTLSLVVLLLTGGPPARAESESDWQAVADAVGRAGELQGNVYRVAFPRTDLKVAVDGVPIKTGLALGGWVAFTREAGQTVMDGDLVLLPEEIGRVVTALQAGGLEVTALHNHLILGMAHSFNFQETENGRVAATGDFVLTDDEVNPVLRQQWAGGIRVMAIHNHLLHGMPPPVFMHFWATGEPAQVGETLKQALAYAKTRRG